MAPPHPDIMQLGDAELCEKLRRDDPEQFQTLVRMHLSFVLDLSSEDCDPTSEKSKFRPLKWVPFSKCRKPVKGVMEGAPLTQEGICQVYQLIEFLSREGNISQEGVFRRSGKLTRQQELKSLLNQGIALSLDDGQFSVHDCASVLKGFLAELPEPLLTDAHYQAYCQVAEMCSGELASSGEPGRLLRALQLLLLLLPDENRTLLRDVMSLLHLAASHQDTNKMSADNLATLFTPHLLCPRKLPPEELHSNAQTMSRVVSFMISRGQEMFAVPPKLATDIRAYFSAAEHRQRNQQQQGEEASTVFSFVDRQLTAAASSSGDTTEAALAKLYAHIQALPESAHKRRLVKQFNKENGHGTPLSRNKLNVSKSLGDSIKKHLFAKGLKRQKQQQQQSAQKLGASSNIKSQSPQSSLMTTSVVDTPDGLDSPANAKRRVLLDTDEEELRVSSTSLQPSTSSPDLAVPLGTDISATTPSPDLIESSLQTDECVSPVAEEALPDFIVSPPLVLSSMTPSKSPQSQQEPVAETPGVGSAPWTSLQLTTSTPALSSQGTPALCKHRGDKSMSPITRSTHRMPRAMQETMMTPRSRKPVLVLSSSNLMATAWEQPEDSTSSLTSTFREYLLSRSVLTASPVSLSVHASPEKLSSSLLYCLDGNDPSTSESSTCSSRKRSADSLFADQSISLSSDSAKKSSLLESSYTSSSCVRETSL